MGQVIIRNVDDDAIRRLKERAQRKGVSLERELRTIVVEAAGNDRAGFRERAAKLRRKLGRKMHGDSTELIREDRDR
jgi:plasmid stability protein